MRSGSRSKRPRSGGKRRKQAQSRPGAPGLLPLFLLAVVAVLGLVGHRRGTWQRLVAPSPPDSLHWVDPAALLPDDFAGTTDPRWGEELRYELSKLPPFRVDDVYAARVLEARLESLSFVASVDELEVTREGIAIDLALREPVACVPVPRGYQNVDAEGFLLSGLWPSPARWDGAPLPVLGPVDTADELYGRARAGDWIVAADQLDALDVALSLQESLTLDERLLLGRVVIDASQARRASVREPGIRLELEGRRLVLFGRAPSAGEPGELPTEKKWRSLVHALYSEQRDPVGLGWDLVDVRWDKPEIVLRNPRVALAEEPQEVATRPSGAPRDRASQSQRVQPQPEEPWRSPQGSRQRVR